MARQSSFTFNPVGLPNKGLVVSGLGDPRTSIVVDGGEDVERSENPGNGETQHSEC